MAAVAVVVALVSGSGVEDLLGSSDRTSDSPRSRGVDSDSGLPVVRVDALPDEALDTLRLIDAGGPFPEDEDGSRFGNYEGILPDHPLGYYAEYTVDTPGVDHRGARRIVTGDGGEYYYTDDHYASFMRIRGWPR